MSSAPGEDVPLRVLDFASLYPSIAVFGLGPDAPVGRWTLDEITVARREWKINNPLGITSFLLDSHHRALSVSMLGNATRRLSTLLSSAPPSNEVATGGFHRANAGPRPDEGGDGEGGAAGSGPPRGAALEAGAAAAFEAGAAAVFEAADSDAEPPALVRP